MPAAQDAAYYAGKLQTCIAAHAAYGASLPPKGSRTSEQMRRLKQLGKEVRNARMPRACDENYKESAQWKSHAKNNDKNNAKRRLKAGDEGYRESAVAKSNTKSNAKRLKAGEEGYDESSRGKTAAALADTRAGSPTLDCLSRRRTA